MEKENVGDKRRSNWCGSKTSFIYFDVGIPIVCLFLYALPFLNYFFGEAKIRSENLENVQHSDFSIPLESNTKPAVEKVPRKIRNAGCDTYCALAHSSKRRKANLL